MKGKPSTGRAMRMSKSSWGAATQNFRPRESHEPAQRSHRAECTLEAGEVVVGWVQPGMFHHYMRSTEKKCTI